jgi:hypothetical protein
MRRIPHSWTKQKADPDAPASKALLLLALLAGVLTLAVAACGGGGNSDGVASLSGSDKATTTTNANSGRDNKPAAALNWAGSMRQHGINLPDPRSPRTVSTCRRPA